MRIEHIALWARDIEKSKQFYEKYFKATSGDKYSNEDKSFASYFLEFKSGCRIEIMNMLNANPPDNICEERFFGISHFAVSVGSKEKVDELTNLIRGDKFTIASEPRNTGDGYYESVVLDPDGNRIEITV